MKTVILCGGIGYRLKEETEFKPKPMVEIGGIPILWHIMKIYSHWGFSDFIIALGYKGNLIKDYFINKKYYDGDFTLSTKQHRIARHKEHFPENFKITFVDTGLESATGERVRRIKKYITGNRFMLTYGDGLSDLNIKDLVKFHKVNGRMCTVTAVFPMLKYGGFDIGAGNAAIKFEKKARVRQPINGGFMVMEKSVLDLVRPNSMIEDVFDVLAMKKQLTVYKHDVFFHSMDTYQDVSDLNMLWETDPAWKIWR